MSTVLNFMNGLDTFKTLSNPIEEKGNVITKQSGNPRTTKYNVGIVFASYELPMEIKVKEKKKIKLECQLTKPVKHVTWFKDDTEITADGHLNITMQAGTHQLVISQATLDDAGKYSCVCGYFRMTCIVSVEELPAKIKTKLCDIEVKENDIIKLECQLTKPDKPVTWLKDDTEITTDDHLNITMNADTHQIVISQATVDDAGKYTCVCGYARTECLVTVEELPAKIKTKLCDFEVKENDIIKLECQLTKPDKPVTWLKDDTEITTDDHLNITMDAEKHQIVISQATVDDAGKYACVCGDVRTECFVTVEELPTEIKTKLCDIEVKENDIIKLECQLTKPDKPVTWLKDDTEITTDDHLNITMDADTHQIVISQATVDDAGKYTCVCGDVRTECLVKVEELPTEIKTKLCDIEVKENDIIKLECQLTKPDKPVTWLKDDTEITTDDHLNITMEADTHQIVIPQATVDDAGKYTCVCGDVRTECLVKVEELPTEIKTKLCDIEVKENDIIKLECQLTKPDKPVTWLKDDTEITTDDHLNITMEADTHQIVISQATVDDAGKYTCVCGDVRTECLVKVEELPTEIKTKLCDIEVKENDIIKLECQLTKPDKPVTWLKDDTEITTDDHLNITMDAETHQIVISQATVDDAGKYACVCGDVRTECFVTVEELPTEIKIKLCDIEVKENDIIKLECQLTKPDKPVTWLKDSTEIATDDHLNITMEADTHQIVISQATVDDAGKYTCVCGDVRTECLVKVEELPTEIKTKLCDIEVKENDIIKLECQLTKPDKPVTWLKDDTEITTDDHLNITMDAETHQIVISQATVDDAGKYACVCGDVRTECFVTVEELPTEIKTKLCDIEVKENDIIKLECQLTKPDKPVTWLKDDTEIATDDHLNITMEADTHQIVISQATVDDAGKYTCVCGDVRTECLVKVEELPTEIKTKLCDIEVKENDIIKLECQLTKPDKPVTWLKDDTEITTDDHLNITMEADTHQIVISHATVDDAGKYTCVCGDVRTECFVTVEELPTEIKTKLCDIEVKENDIIKLECQLTKPDKPVTWLKDDTEITTDDHLNITMVAETHQIVISQATVDDAGKYACVCGDVRTECLVKVEELPTGIRMKLCDIKVIENEIIKLECKLTKPDKPVTWLKDDTEITADDHLNITMHADTHQIVISQATVDDAGHYACVCGDVKTECTVTVIEGMNATLVGSVRVKTANESCTSCTCCTCAITGSDVLPGDKLILADNHYGNIKLLNLQTSAVTSELKVSGPWGVASINNNEVAVTLRDGKIVFVTVTSVLKLDREISVDGACTDIVYNNGKLVVAFNLPTKIEIMTLNGTVEKTIKCPGLCGTLEHIALNPTNGLIYWSLPEHRDRQLASDDNVNVYQLS